MMLSQRRLTAILCHTSHSPHWTITSPFMRASGFTLRSVLPPAGRITRQGEGTLAGQNSQAL